MENMNDKPCAQCKFTHFFTRNPMSAPFWLVVRVYLGWQWFSAGYEKFTNPAWFGTHAGAALNGFLQGAIAKTTCAANIPVAACHPDVQMWYASFLQNAVIPHVMVWSNAVTLGEMAIGLGLIVGLFTCVAAFFGFFMNINFLLAGTVSTSPIMLVLALGIMLAHKVAGLWGLDRFAKPYLHDKFCRCKNTPNV
jgi:thiosulfate dehydrogenase [quinone] large subunit